MNRITRFTMIMASAAMVMGCADRNREKVPAINLSDLDTTCSPAVDFYQYATFSMRIPKTD